MAVENPAHRTGPRVRQVAVSDGYDLPSPTDVTVTRHDDDRVTLELDASTAAVLMSAVREQQQVHERAARKARADRTSPQQYRDLVASWALRLATVWEANAATRESAPQPWMD